MQSGFSREGALARLKEIACRYNDAEADPDAIAERLAAGLTLYDAWHLTWQGREPESRRAAEHTSTSNSARELAKRVERETVRRISLEEVPNLELILDTALKVAADPPLVRSETRTVPGDVAGRTPRLRELRQST